MYCVTGNTKLQKWSLSSIRRAGLCEDHFPKDSFTNSAKKSLKRSAISIPFTETSNINIENNEEEQMEQEQANIQEAHLMKRLPHLYLMIILQLKNI